MHWPEKPTCHSSEVRSGFQSFLIWREPSQSEPYAYPYRTCGYCGSIHPEDLIKALEAGTAGLDGSDWKYGWPHKFYVEGIPNPLAGNIVKTGSRTADGITTPIMGPAPNFVHAKWYNVHIQDLGYDEEALTKLLSLLKQHSNIEFELKDGSLRYKAPYRGYQHQSPHSQALREEAGRSINPS